MPEVRQRHQVANYLNVGTAETPNFALMGTGFTRLDENPAAQTTSKRYVNDRSTSKRVSGYDWSAPFTTDMIIAEPAVAYIKGIGEMQKTGGECETDYVIVHLDEPVASTTNTFRARKFRVAVEVAAFADADGEETCSGNLLGIGDPVEGTAVIASGTITFTPTAAAATT